MFDFLQNVKNYHALLHIYIGVRMRMCVRLWTLAILESITQGRIFEKIFKSDNCSSTEFVREFVDYNSKVRYWIKQENLHVKHKPSRSFAFHAALVTSINALLPKKVSSLIILKHIERACVYLEICFLFELLLPLLSLFPLPSAQVGSQ